VQKVALEQVFPWPVTIPAMLHTCASSAGSYEVIAHTDFSNSFLLPAKKKGKGKGHPCTGTEALYRPYGP